MFVEVLRMTISKLISSELIEENVDILKVTKNITECMLNSFLARPTSIFTPANGALFYSG